MNPKQQFIKVLNHELPDYIPHMEVEFQIQKEYISDQFSIGFDFQKLSTKEKEIALHKNAEILVQVAGKAGHNTISNIGNYWEIAPGVPGYLWLPTAEDSMKQLEILVGIASKEYFIIDKAGVGRGIPRGHQLYEYSMKLFDDPGGIKEECEKIYKNGLEHSLRLIDKGVDCVITPVDIAFNNGTFLSPEQLDELFFPYLRAWAARMKKERVFTIWHTDGNINAVMNRTLESGIDAVQCVDPLGGMDIGGLVEKYGERFTFIGNVNCAVLHIGKKDEIIAETNRVLNACAYKKGFVFGGCNAIFDGISAENYQLCIDTKREFEKNFN